MDSIDYNDEPPLFSLRELFVFVSIVVLITAIAVSGFRVYNGFLEGVDAFYTVTLTHDMMRDYISENDGQWPSDWEDLKPHFATYAGIYGDPDFAKLRDRIEINFAFDPLTVDSSKAARDGDIWILRMADGTDFGELKNANESIRSVFRGRVP